MYPDREPYCREGGSASMAVKVLLAIFLAISLGWLIRETYIYWMVEQANRHFIHSRGR